MTAITDLLLTNQAVSLLAANVLIGATACAVTPGDGNLKFPATAGGKYFMFNLIKADKTYEICKCTSRTGDTLDTIVRAQEGTAAMAFTAGDAIEVRLTAGNINDIIAYLTTTLGTSFTGSLSGDWTFTGDLNISSADIDLFPSGMTIEQFQVTVPLGWTVDGSFNDRVPIIRSTNTVAGGSGGTWTFSGATSGPVTLTAAQSGLVAHTHAVPITTTSGGGAHAEASETSSGSFNVTASANASAPAASSHSHALTFGNTWRPAYVYCWLGERT